MRALFWRRKNARLATRLNTLVETSERVRKNRRRKPPRVVIDTSYVEQAEAEAQWVEADHTCEQDAAPEHLQQYEDVGTGEADEFYADQASYEQAPAHLSDDDEDEESTILREAIEQLDLAEAGEAEALERESAALKEVEAQRARVERLEADIAEEQQVRAEVEQALEDFRNSAATQPDADAVVANEVAAREAAEASEKTPAPQPGDPPTAPPAALDRDTGIDPKPIFPALPTEV